MTEYYPKITSSLPTDLKSFITVCIYDSPVGQRLNQKLDCKLLKNHKFLVFNKNENMPSDEEAEENTNSERVDRNNGFDDCKIKTKQDDNVAAEFLLDTFTDYPLQSRLNTEFEVIGIVGRGAFGEGEVRLSFILLLYITESPSPTKLTDS